MDKKILQIKFSFPIPFNAKLSVLPGSDLMRISQYDCIIYRCAYSQIKIRKISDKKLSVFTAGGIFWPISRVMGVINEFGLRWFASFTDALAAR